MSTRVRWPFLLAAALAAVAALLTHLWPVTDAELSLADDLPTSAQAQPATNLAASLPAIAGSTRDRYDTACRFATPYCVTSMTLSARDIASGIEALLLARGARATKPMSCQGTCVVPLAFGGLSMVVTAKPRQDFNGVRSPGRGFVVIVADAASPPSRALPAWPELRLLPAAWGTPPCVERDGVGCSHYLATLRVHAPLAPVVGTIRKRLARSGLALDAALCFLDPPSPNCMFGGNKFRSIGGRDPLGLSIYVRPGPRGFTDVNVQVTNF